MFTAFVISLLLILSVSSYAHKGFGTSRDDWKKRIDAFGVEKIEKPSKIEPLPAYVKQVLNGGAIKSASGSFYNRTEGFLTFIEQLQSDSCNVADSSKYTSHN